MAEKQFGMRELLELKDKQIQQLKKELDDTKELVLELSESELILQEAQNVRQEAQEERKAARKERETAAHYIQDGKQERQLYADTKAKIDQEKADWNNLIRYSHIILKIRNNYEPDFFDVQAGRIIGLSRMHQRLTGIVDECMNIGIVMKGDSGKAAIAHNGGILQMRPEEYASILMGDSDSFTTVMQSWLIESPWISYRVAQQ